MTKRNSPIGGKNKKRKRKVLRRHFSQKKKKLSPGGKDNKPEAIKKIKVRLIGIGGGGSSIVSEIAQRVKGASFLAANSDLKDLSRLSRKVGRFYFGEELTHGLGTGMNPDIGEEAAKNERDRIKKILEGQDLVILIACLGGGLGSGAVPVFAKISKDLGNLTYGIFTLPFKFEGEKKVEIAKKSLELLKTRLSAFSIIPNERIFQLIERTAPLNKALSAINKHLSDSLQSLIEIIYKPALINIDFADLRTIFEGRGKLTYLNSINIGKEEEEQEAIKKVINSPLYPYSISGAKGILFNISGRKDLSLMQVNQISGVISEKAHREAKIIFGVSGAKTSSKIRVTLLATGCGEGVFFKKEKNAPKVKKIKKPKKRKNPSSGGVRKIKVRSVPPEPVVPKPPVPKKKTKKKKKKRVKIRKNAVQIQKDMEEEEAEIVSKEKAWDTPTFLRKENIQE
jgi:cell division protein FtsZ